MVSRCEAPQEDNHVVLACLAKGPSLKSVQITLKLEGQDQIQETKLIVLDRRHTQLSLLVTPQEPGPYHCNAVSWSPSHHMEKPIQWPGGRPPDPRGWPAGSPAPATQRTRTRPAPGPLKSCPHRPCAQRARESVAEREASHGPVPTSAPCSPLGPPSCRPQVLLAAEQPPPGAHTV